MGRHLMQLYETKSLGSVKGPENRWNQLYTARQRFQNYGRRKARGFRAVSTPRGTSEESTKAARTEEPEPSTSGRNGFLREAEVLHARWAMLGILGLIVPDILGQNLYLLPDLASQRLVPFTIQLVVAIGVLEGYRGAQRMQRDDLDSRVYPGQLFDVLGVTQKRNPTPGKEEPAPGLGVYSSWLGGLPGWLSGAWWFEKREMTQQQVSDMKRTELSSGRIAMVAFAGAYAASMITGRGPITLLQDHMADPLNNSILHFFQ
eukprot:jgi/Botrbrau1/21264/Bobra.39_2s0055.1